ncbi:hypothetical protein [Streptomyces sp. Go-475]|uniref:hypothetical protein n=1 Tax=Streptomyces sp. Go-475 TaxID=2072505 RepID=UPI000DF0CE0B|nr:hypothetical protein [Streptomyces sp. Go-475]AXE86032.1 hypothetical protein C1703_13550 [Streptomyces sp. Go-475]
MSDGADHHNAGGRLLPWAIPEGRPCCLVGDGTGYASRLADEIEGVQLGMAGELLGHASELLAERRVTSVELHHLARRLTESLRDVKRIAESRRGLLVRGPGHDPGGDRGPCAPAAPSSPCPLR